MKHYILGIVEGILATIAGAVIIYLVYAWLALPVVYYCDHFPVSCETSNGVYGVETMTCKHIIKGRHVAEESNNCHGGTNVESHY